MNARAVAALLGSSWIGLAACSDVVGGVRGSPAVTGPVGNQVDLLFVIDGAPGAGEAQRVLAASVSEILLDLVNPRCVDPLGGHELRVEDATIPCPQGLARAIDPVATLNVGVISSNLGSLGEAPCDGLDATALHGNDGGRLLTRGASDPELASYIRNGAVKWRRDTADAFTYEALESTVEALILGVGDQGCPYSMPLEAMTRFLVDPAPYEHLALTNDRVTPTSVDDVILLQRSSFLRDDSVVAVFVLAPNGDCSVRPNGRSTGLFSRASGETPSAAMICASDPEHQCCHPCDEAPPDGCLVDLACLDHPTLPPEADPLGMRCVDQRRRFGTSLLYPVARFANALRLANIDRDSGDLASRDGTNEPNPLFMAGRARDRVGIAVAAGLPWETIARDPARLEEGMMPVAEIPGTTIAAIAGDPDAFVAPTNPFQIESAEPRPGVLPGNFTNGGDRPADGNPQYACIYPLAAPIWNPACPTEGSSPICVSDVQTHAYATPGLRPISFAASLRERSALASACAPYMAESSPHYGYRPALRDLLKRISPMLFKPAK